MSYVLIFRNQAGRPDILARYKTHKGAVIGMRASNRNAGWTRISLCGTAHLEMEWCARSNGLPVYDYAPYGIMHEHIYNQKYLKQEQL